MIRVACIRCGRVMVDPAAWVIGHFRHGSGPVGPDCLSEVALSQPLPLSVVLTPPHPEDVARRRAAKAGQVDWVATA